MRVAFFICSKVECISHTIPDYSRVVNRGLNHIIAEAEEKMEYSADKDTTAFYEAVKLTLQGVINYAHNLSDEAKQLIDSAREEMATLNNEGVSLVKSGKLKEAVGLFLKAADGLPRNRTVNLNAAQVLIMQIKQEGMDQRYLNKAKEFLDRVRQIDPSNEKYTALMKLLDEVHT